MIKPILSEAATVIMSIMMTSRLFACIAVVLARLRPRVVKSFEYTGVNAELNPPSPNMILNRLTSLNAAVNASLSGPVPIVKANIASRIHPKMRETNIVILTTRVDLVRDN